MLREKAMIMDQKSMERGITRISHEILEKNKGATDIVIIGIHRRGIRLAKKIAKKIFEIENIQVSVGGIDITNYRDDIKEKNIKNIENDISKLDISEKKVVLVDDVLYTGRTVRAAMDALIDMGRPKAIQLAVLIDRGHRELPIRADYVGKNLPTSKEEIVKVYLEEMDEKTGVFILEEE